MTGTISADFARKFTAIVSRFASPHEGEIVAAAHAANRMLAAAGLTWLDMVHPPVPAPESTNQRQAGDGATWRAQVDFCLGNPRGLNWREIDFLLGLRGFPEPSAKQAKWLSAIVAKVRKVQGGAA